MTRRRAARSGAAREPARASGAAPPGRGRTLAASLFVPTGATRRAKRRAARAARAVEVAARRDARDRELDRAAAERDERRDAAYIARRGEPGPAALRSYRRFAVQAHRATSDVLAGAYPFLAEAGLGSNGLFIGADVWSGSGFCFDPWVLYEHGVLSNPNAVLAGVIGKGKSTLAKSLATRSIAFGRRVYVPGDPKGEWSEVARRVGGQAIELGAGLSSRLNPLDEGPRPSGLDETSWRALVESRRRGVLGSLAQTSLGRSLAPTEHTALDVALETARASSSTPVLPMVVDALLAPSAPGRGSTIRQLELDGREAAHALRRLVYGDLAGLFDGPSSVSFDPSLPLVSLDLSRISGSDTLIALVMSLASAWMEAALADVDGGKRWVIYDEAWRLLRQPALLARMQSQWKLSRALGIANLMVIHRISDLDAVGDASSEARALALGLLADCSTKIVYAQEEGEAAKTAAALGLSVTERDELPTLARGEGLWRIGQRSFVVRHDCTDAELELFDTNARMTS